MRLRMAVWYAFLAELGDRVAEYGFLGPLFGVVGDRAARHGYFGMCVGPTGNGVAEYGGVACLFA